ncbi:hypothetical protein ACFCZT_14185 [Streptomyces sp. NPDC056230]|uniref:hypothetical protein n=1 Tax=unclassified Streptomyces TaxID=2593676 RepID=UPI0035DE7B36
MTVHPFGSRVGARSGESWRLAPARTRPVTRRAGCYVQADIDGWLAHALATHLGHYRDPAAREAAAGLLPPPVLARAVLLGELVRLVPGADVGQLAFVARLATTEPEAVGELAAFLSRARLKDH